MPEITTLAELEALYGTPAAPSLFKETDRMIPEYRALIEAAPFCVLASVGPEGLDCSPRGDAPGFVAVEDERTLLLPDRRGNNRIDSLRNILRDARVALLFLVPGLAETLRVNGRASILAGAICERFAVAGKAPRSVLRVEVERVFFQCGRALLRSRLWDPQAHVARESLPSAGRMLAAAEASFDGAAYDAALPERQKATLY